MKLLPLLILITGCANPRYLVEYYSPTATGTRIGSTVIESRHEPTWQTVKEWERGIGEGTIIVNLDLVR